jgi:hypothetical protein
MACFYKKTLLLFSEGGFAFAFLNQSLPLGRPPSSLHAKNDPFNKVGACKLGLAFIICG